MRNSLFRETQNFAKHEISQNSQLVSRNNETRFASSFAKQKPKRVSLETLAPPQYCGQILVTSEKSSSNGDQPYKAFLSSETFCVVNLSTCISSEERHSNLYLFNLRPK
jgi:hypothetical protein